jgi:hypothetical protein
VAASGATVLVTGAVVAAGGGAGGGVVIDVGVTTVCGAMTSAGVLEVVLSVTGAMGETFGDCCPADATSAPVTIRSEEMTKIIFSLKNANISIKASLRSRSVSLLRLR